MNENRAVGRYVTLQAVNPYQGGEHDALREGRAEACVKGHDGVVAVGVAPRVDRQHLAVLAVRTDDRVGPVDALEAGLQRGVNVRIRRDRDALRCDRRAKRGEWEGHDCSYNVVTICTEP